MNEIQRDGGGRYLPTKHNTKLLKAKVDVWMTQGLDDTEIAKKLMMDHDVKLYYAVKLIQIAKKEN